MLDKWQCLCWRDGDFMEGVLAEIDIVSNIASWSNLCRLIAPLSFSKLLVSHSNSLILRFLPTCLSRSRSDDMLDSLLFLLL